MTELQRWSKQETVQSEQQQEFYRLTEAASVALDEVAESASFIQVFSFWKLPAFHNHTRTTLYAPKRPGTDKQPFFTISTWMREVDLEKLRDPVERLKHPKVLIPTITESTIMVSIEAAAEVVSNLADICLPTLRPTEGVLGLDGIGYRFCFSQGFYGLDLRWWVDLPHSWHPALERIKNVVAWLEDQKLSGVQQGGGG